MGNPLIWTNMKIFSATVLSVLALCSVLWAGQGDPSQQTGESGTASQEEFVYIVNEYRYEPAGSMADSDTGQSLCGTRCNALSVDYKNYLQPRGWRLKRVAKDQELNVDLNNPFITGRCVCVADKYLIKVHDLYMSK